jgi:hypothetical protein
VSNVRRRRAACAVALAAVLAACSGDPDGSGDPDRSDGPGAPVTADAGPYQPGGDWEVRAPEDLGMDARTLDGAREYAFAGGMNTQGVVVVRSGAIVGEWYANGADQDSWAASWSMAKSFTSALVGIAISEGQIPSVDVPMTTYYPQWEGTRREEITLRHVLQMASGLEFDETYNRSGSDIARMVLSQKDQLAFAADRPYLHPPGTAFSYSSGDSLLLSGMLEQATGQSAADYARQKLFDPLGMEQVEWWQDAAGHTLTYCCLDTTSRDFARFGLLYLREGAWGESQVVPADWVADSLAPSDSFAGYGYQWWLRRDLGAVVPGDTFAALGHDGQYLYVIPSLELVVVRNGTYIKYDGEPVADPNLFDRYPNSTRPDLGTLAPERGWDDAAFLAPIVNSIESLEEAGS